MSELEEFAIGIGRAVIGMFVLIGGLVILDVIIYISVTGSTLTERVTAAYAEGYDKAYPQTYDVGYQQVYAEAYDKGYDKGYEIGLGSSSKGDVATRVELHNPTYKELNEFLARDETDSNPFIRGEYVCFHFAAELNNSAEANGIRAAYVRIRSKEWGHAVVAFQTADRGLIFIEPQSDEEVELVIAEPYPWQQVGATRPTDYDVAIDEIQIIW